MKEKPHASCFDDVSCFDIGSTEAPKNADVAHF